MWPTHIWLQVWPCLMPFHRLGRWQDCDLHTICCCGVGHCAPKWRWEWRGFWNQWIQTGCQIPVTKWPQFSIRRRRTIIRFVLVLRTSMSRSPPRAATLQLQQVKRLNSVTLLGLLGANYKYFDVDLRRQKPRHRTAMDWFMQCVHAWHLGPFFTDASHMSELCCP